jgi:pimeloyl-ACP methyl ester carboxylesterase
MEDALTLYRSYAAREIDRREFLRRASALGIAGPALAAANASANEPAGAAVPQAAEAAAAASSALELADWSYFWVGVTRATLARGTVVNGAQMYVEYWTPATIRHPYPIVMVHGGGGQGLDWLARPDGGPGWVTYLLQEGYRVYLVDRPGHGRSPFHPDLHGRFPERASTYATVERQFTAPEKAATPYGPVAKLHTEWPGTGVLGDPTVDQVIASQGGSYTADLAATHAHWGVLGGQLLDKIGPSIVMAHSAGGPSCWIYANARPALVKGIVAVEPNGPAFGNLRWGLTASRLEYDPPAGDASELQTVEVKPAGPNRDPYKLLAKPRKLRHLQGIPIAVVTAPASYHYPYDLGSVALLRQCGCTVEHIELEQLGITGNGHFMMMERNNREVLQPILRFLQAQITDKAPRPAPPRRAARADESPAVSLAGHGFFWVNVERKTMPYGVIPAGQMYVQYLVPREVRRDVAVVLVHGGTGQMLHYMGTGDGVPGWAHYFVQAGYRVYLVDRAGHGRAVYHPDALGPIGSTPTFEQVAPNFARVARGPNRRWMGTGEIGDPLLDQFMASQNGAPLDYAAQLALWARGGAALLDRIGPAVVLTHSAGGPFGWLVADERPDRVKAVVCFEGTGAPLTAVPAVGFTRVRPLANVKGIPMLYLTADASGRTEGPAIVTALAQSGAAAEHVNLRDRGLLGNGHFAMLESNRKQVFDVVRAWIESKV